jgi:hypothetical protein
MAKWESRERRTMVHKNLHRKFKFEDTKGVIRSRKSYKDIPSNYQKKQDETTSNCSQNTTENYTL